MALRKLLLMKKILFISLLLFSVASFGQTPLHFLIAKKASAGFSPPSGCRLWVKSDQITGLSDGEPVTTWEDQSGNSNDLIGGDGTSPTYQTNEINSLPAIRFDGTDDFLEKSSPTGLDGGTGLTIIIAVKQSASSDDTYLAKWDYQTQGSWAWQTKSGDAQNMTCYIASSLTDAGGNNQVSTGASLTNTWFVLSMVYDGSQGTNTDRVKFYKNGTITSLSTSGTLSTSLTSCTATLKVGKFGGTLPRVYAGDFAEIFIFDSALGTTDRESVEDYLLAKYGL